MSKQLAISAAISVFAMAAFAIFTTPDSLAQPASGGHAAAISADANPGGFDLHLPDLAAPRILAD